ncbi:MAG: hypothetical protein IJ652_02315 [Bacteroidales bacterium]|nr:hypothetical protein [Bacteroidales bacterium]
MKKSLIIILAALALSLTAAAQPKAIGIRGGLGGELSYQHYLGGENFLEVDGGIFGYNSLAIVAAATYNFMIVRPDWTPRGEWGFYAGPGAALGTWTDGSNSAFNLGVGAQVGLEYTFWFPLNISIDVRPMWGFMSHGLYGSYAALGLRYAF